MTDEIMHDPGERDEDYQKTVIGRALEDGEVGELLRVRLGDEELEIEYRLSWEMCDPHQANRIESEYGRGIWTRVTDEDWAKLTWQKVSRVTKDLIDIADQRAQLHLWSETHDQPIRNVVLERRAIHLKEWETVL